MLLLRLRNWKAPNQACLILQKMEGRCLSVQEYLLMSAISEEGLYALHLVD